MKNIHPYFRSILKHILIWTFAFSFFNFFREFGHPEVKGLSNALSFPEMLLFQLLVGLVAGMLFGSYNYLIEQVMGKILSFGRLVLIAGTGYMVVIMILLVVTANTVLAVFDAEFSQDDLRTFFENGNHYVIGLYCFIVGFLIDFINQIDRKFGPGNLWKMLKGTYFHPVQEERLLMFLDMRSSTTIAEELGHIKYSRLVQDCFKDISVIANHGGHIYQYVGDEAVLTWEGHSAFVDNNCVKAYFAFCDQLESRREYYESEYGLLPEFKAGMNVGLITTAEVGDIKREIAFHGDTINTAARIQGRCNDLGFDFLASDSVIQRLNKHPHIELSSVGALILKGKNEEVEIHAIERR